MTEAKSMADMHKELYPGETGHDNAGGTVLALDSRHMSADWLAEYRELEIADSDGPFAFDSDNLATVPIKGN